MKQTTILFLQREGQLLLAMKKRGFGVGKWNGTGGKVEAGESIRAAAIRETEEEIGVTPLEPTLRGRLRFRLFEQNKLVVEYDCNIFVATKWRGGEPVETEEMRPQWFAVDAIPYDQMWEDDIHWLPVLLQGQCFMGSADLDGDRLTAHAVTTVQHLPEEPDDQTDY